MLNLSNNNLDTRINIVFKVNDLRIKYYNAVLEKKAFFNFMGKIIITRFAKVYLSDLESKFKTLN